MALISASPNKIIWRLIKWGAATLFTLIVGLLLLPFFVNINEYKPEIISAFKKQTGHDLIIDGEISLSVLPNLAVKIRQASVGNTSWGDAPVMARMSELRLHLQILPLFLFKQLKLDELVLDQPEIFLEKNKDGQANWSFLMAASNASPGKQPVSNQGGHHQPVGIAPEDVNTLQISLKQVRIHDGHLSYQDKKAGVSEIIEKIQLSIALSSLQDPLTLSGSLTWREKTIQIRTDIATPRAILTQGMTPLRSVIESDPLNVNISGQLDLASLTLSADVALSMPSLRGAAKWVGVALPADLAVGKLEAFSFDGHLSADPRQIDLNTMTIVLDEVTANGDIAVSLVHKVPALKANLALSDLDITPYFPQQQADVVNQQQTVASSTAQQLSAQQEWDTTEIDLSALKVADIDFSLKTQKLIYQKLLIDSADIELVLKQGDLRLLLKQIALYQGHGKADIKIRTTAKPYKIDKKVTVSQVKAYDLLRDVANIDRLEGTGNLDIDLRASGVSKHQFVANLNGTAECKFFDGAIIGLNLGQMVRNVTSAFMAKKERQKTDFAELSGRIKITNGIAQNNDLILKAPLLTVQGAGQSNLVKKQIDYRLTPKVVASVKGQERSEEMKGLAVPINVTGHWENLSYQPDLAAMLSLDTSGVVSGLTSQLDQVKDPVKFIEETIQNVPEKIIPNLLQDKDPLKTLLNLGGKDTDTSEPLPQEAVEKAPRPLEGVGKALKGFLSH